MHDGPSSVFSVYAPKGPMTRMRNQGCRTTVWRCWHSRQTRCCVARPCGPRPSILRRSRRSAGVRRLRARRDRAIRGRRLADWWSALRCSFTRPAFPRIRGPAIRHWRAAPVRLGPGHDACVGHPAGNASPGAACGLLLAARRCVLLLACRRPAWQRGDDARAGIAWGVYSLRGKAAGDPTPLRPEFPAQCADGVAGCSCCRPSRL